MIHLMLGEEWHVQSHYSCPAQLKCQERDGRVATCRCPRSGLAMQPLLSYLLPQMFICLGAAVRGKGKGLTFCFSGGRKLLSQN